MKLEGDYLFDASVPDVWSALFDPVILAAVMPGCEKLDLVDGSYIGDIKVKVGPIQGKFTGKVDLVDKDEPRSYKMIVDGRGAPGFIKATASVTLAAEGTGTRVHYDTDAQVGGKIASVGQRLIEASARAIVAQSLEGLHTNIKLRAEAYRAAAAQQAAAPDASAGAPAVAAAAEPAAATAAEPTAVNRQITDAVSPATEPAVAASAAVIADAASEAKAADVVTAVKPTAINAQVTDAVSAATDAAVAASAAVIAEAAAKATPAAATPPAKPAVAPAVAFTPVKVKQADLANAVAKEVAASMFPRSVLVAIILIEALVIVWLLIRH